MIQIERPVGWTQEKVRKLAIEVKTIEIYNSVAKGQLETTRRKWGMIR